MLALLMSGVLKLEAVKESADFLIEIMPLMFIPAAAGLLDSWHELEDFPAAGRRGGGDDNCCYGGNRTVCAGNDQKRKKETDTKRK